MGALFSRFRWKRTPSPGAEVNEEQKEESTSEKDGIPVPSSPSQDTVVTVTSSGGDKIQESPTKSEAPLAREEEAFTQQASPVAEEPKEKTKPGDEAKTGDVEAPEPEVKELQRVNETKLEKEKTVDTSGVTTEKTVYTQVSESVKIQETKGPAVDPFASSQTVFPPFSKSWYESKPQAKESQSSPSYVHSVKVTERSFSPPSSPASVSSEAVTPEKTQSVHQVSESVSENVASVPEKIEVSIKTGVAEVATDVAESLSDRYTDEPQSEKQEVKSPSLTLEEEKSQIEQDVPSSEAEVVDEDQIFSDGERSEVEGAVVKIQAGIRGYLTRKSLKESRKDGPLMQSAKGGASVQPSSKQDEIEEPLVSTAEIQAITEAVQAATEEVQADTESLIMEDDESNAAVKIQAMYRGYRTRKQLDELLIEPCDAEIETLNISGEQTEPTAQESRRSPPDRSPVTVTENFVPILKAQVTITPPSSPTIKKENSINISCDVEAAPEDSKTSAIPEKSGDIDETADTGMLEDDEDDEGKKQAATKIQAAFRGYKVRKTSRKEASGNVKEISEETKGDMRYTPSPPLELENDDDNLEDDNADDIDEVPNVQWQTSELYAGDSDLSPKHSHEHDESKTESVTEEATVPVLDSPKTTKISSAQVILSTSKVSVDESSHGNTMPTTAEDKEVESDH